MSAPTPILKAISEARNAHGLRLQDPVRYNAYCSKRILSLKRALKFVHKTKKTAPKRVTPDLVMQDSRYLEIVLFSAERAWSQSASLKTEEIHQKKRHYIARRLVKAVRHAETLVALLQQSGADSQTQLEARAYRATLAGQSAFENKRWDVALREYSIGKVILDVLLSKADESSRSVYKDASTTVDPSLRYCGYQLQTGSQGDILTLAQAHLSREPALVELLQDINPAALQPRRDSSAPAGIRAIQWRFRTAPLDNPEIVVSLLKVQDTQTSFHERNTSFDLSATEKAAAMDEILNAWAETEDAVRRVIDEGAGMRTQDKEQALQIILTYVSFHFISTRVQRDVLLIKDLEKKKEVNVPVLKDLVKLHDSIIQSIQQIFDLPGVATDTDLMDDLEAKQTYFKASRSMLIARSHTLLKDHISALALYEKAQTYLTEIPQSLASFPEKDIPVYEADVRTQISLLRGEMTRCHSHVILSRPSVTESTYFQTKPLASRLHQFPRPSAIDLTNLVELPPKYEDVPIKPFFFDISYSYVGLKENNVRVPASKGAAVVGRGLPQKGEDKFEPAKRGWFWNR